LTGDGWLLTRSGIAEGDPTRCHSPSWPRLTSSWIAARHGVHAEGYDISPEMMEIAREAAAEEHADAVFEVARPTTVDEINELLRAAAGGPLSGILGYEDRPLVSIDYKDDPRSAIVDALSTRVTDRTQVKVLAWYDNEWGYANRMVELAAIVAGSLTPA